MVNAEELHHPDDFVVVTVDIEDCPLAELPLAEIFDVTTSTLNIDYLVTLREYITQQLEDTSWLDDQSMTPLFDAGFATFFRKPNGDIVSMRKPALQRLIAQTLRDRTDNLSPISIPIFIRFLIPDNTRPTRVIVGVGTTVPSVIGGTGTVRSPGVAANCDANLSKATLHEQTRSGVKLVQDRPNKKRRFADARWYATKQETIRIRVVSRLEGLAYEAITVPLHPYDRRPARMQLR